VRTLIVINLLNSSSSSRGSRPQQGGAMLTRHLLLPRRWRSCAAAEALQEEQAGAGWCSRKHLLLAAAQMAGVPAKACCGVGSQLLRLLVRSHRQLQHGLLASQRSCFLCSQTRCLHLAQQLMHSTAAAEQQHQYQLLTAPSRLLSQTTSTQHRRSSRLLHQLRLG
jgi:hypothetical protein